MNPLSFLRELRKLNYIRGLTKQREYGDVKKEDNDKLAVNYDVHLGFRFSPDLEPCKSWTLAKSLEGFYFHPFHRIFFTNPSIAFILLVADFDWVLKYGWTIFKTQNGNPPTRRT